MIAPPSGAIATRLMQEAGAPPRRTRPGWEDLERDGDSTPAGSKSSNSTDSKSENNPPFRIRKTAQDARSRAVAFFTKGELASQMDDVGPPVRAVTGSLLAQTVAGDGGAIALDIGAAQIGEQPASAANHLQQTAT